MSNDWINQSSQTLNKKNNYVSKHLSLCLNINKFRLKAHKKSRSVSTLLEPSPKNILNKNGIISCQHFRGVPQTLIESHTKSVCNAMTIDDLYEEILYEITNNVGCESESVCTETLLEFAQQVFRIPDEKHEEILTASKNKEPPKIRLNIEIIKAENLIPKDSNGLSDPFVTLFLESNSTHRYNSSVKPDTLNPIWEEHFSLPITENPREEKLIVEVWDFDAAESVKEKVNKIFEVKGVRGLRKLVKEIALTASTGRHDNELIGRTTITLKSVPISGSTVWFNLEKGSKAKNRGSILISLSLSAEKNKYVAIQEHRHLLKLLFIHELESLKTTKFCWDGKFNPNSELIRTQHSVQSGLSNFECSLSQWVVYTSFYKEHPISFKVLNELLEVITPFLICLQRNSEEVKQFRGGLKQILPSCFSVLRKLRTRNDQQAITTLVEVLNLISQIKEFVLPIDTSLFPQNEYTWIPENTDIEEYDINDIATFAINSGTNDWLEYIVEGSKPKSDDECDESILLYLIKLIQMIRSDLQKAMEYFDKHFYHKLHINYSTVLFKFYDKKLTEIIEPIIVKISANMERLNVPDDRFEYLPNIDNVNMGTTLFELYIVLKRFLTLGKSLLPNEQLDIENFYTWFIPGVTHWLDISILKALNRIDKAIELDRLKAVDETVKYSSSAVDTLAIFYQIKIFWQQLDWPDVEGAYTFVAKIVDDICRCCVFYAQRMSKRVEYLTKDNTELFIVSTEWCFAINNIDYICQSLPAFILELGANKVIEQLGEIRTHLESERCKATIQNVIDNALDTERNQIQELIAVVARKMAPSIKRFLAEGSEVLYKDSNSMEKLMNYMENSLSTLYNILNEVNFGRMLDCIWAELSIIMYDLIQSNLDKRRPPAFFQNLKHTLQVMVKCFKMENFETSDVEVLIEIEKLLNLHGFETAELIHQYYLERMEYQKEIKNSKFGQLAIKAYFTENSLKLNILNGRSLVPMDSNGSCDSFVKVHFLPTNKFIGVSALKTAVKSKSCFPLYDEHFSINLTEEQQNNQDSLILFSIKDKDLFGMTNQYIGECYITFADIVTSEQEQIHMELSRPELTKSDVVRALEFRQGDKQAKDFLKKLKNKSYS
ncbi:protein unc-13 homolog 4B isoform X2 [Teleopsis dalmanni]|uniref:protein unc-13 homolog 4B isoform X2 n=1 Tax=Teleopsis dalmanni TaxID=139649 RepID=UPI0018CFCA51|nr:protein unc-13 homolog 4B isoform X2 [Teleopsis dalmanni]